MRSFYLFFLSIHLYIHSSSATCYLPNGAADPTGEQAACNSNGGHSMCCLLNIEAAKADTCRSDGLCIPSDNGAVYRDTCTDSTWSDPACLNLCTTGTNHFGYESADNWEPLTTCADGSFCCGFPRNSTGQDCCKKKEGRFVENGKIVITPPASTSATGTSQTSRPTPATITSFATTTPTAKSDSSSTNTGAIVGGVVGGVAAIAILGLALWYVMIRRSLNQRAQTQQAGYEHQMNRTGEQKWPVMHEATAGYPHGTELRAGELDTTHIRAPELEGAGWQGHGI